MSATRSPAPQRTIPVEMGAKKPVSKSQASKTADGIVGSVGDVGGFFFKNQNQLVLAGVWLFLAGFTFLR